ncbi:MULTISPECIES: nucleotidyl transferase AbiEii/AbiGii toxin family protein [unclassified Sulfitobacter]|uniref:nucleotidyl transferase AbiEii/AbiGii toxin family protein n=1 Tax=unclassified Sulfitobacter TaxID=196795 RepID=UPI0007C20522|nr:MULTISPECIES: nucleotidyl transferase AbiEii/AbiGii toxin family protein [unclassified Sulfitobacter]KZX95603.1 hypothetical protein A3720_20870 [Sulfitobacter sp. HI0021]KZY03304.1 hypothetical protein A3722_20840 [Sulfitobacter sp. HI0027]KZZ01235.1 hypothetical protein A3747_19700 [Sulfitobacter sp. HI0076]
MTESQTYFSLSREDKIDALEVAASKLGRPADLLEKDIWVVWVLNALFDSDLGEHLVFKGGTSLSKVYKAIDRFSEDVDLTYDIRQIIPDAYCLRGAFRGGDRYARHWYDLDRLQAVGIAARALEDKPLAQDVAKHKQHFFRETDRAGATINYADAVSGSLCLIPEGVALEALAQDYQKMQEAGLLQSDSIAFDDLIARLMVLQDRANNRAA